MIINLQIEHELKRHHYKRPICVKFFDSSFVSKDFLGNS